jgi:hypothetical protein
MQINNARFVYLEHLNVTSLLVSALKSPSTRKYYQKLENIVWLQYVLFFFDEFNFSLKAVHDFNGKYEGKACLYVRTYLCIISRPTERI